jgi:hypothetical protein
MYMKFRLSQQKKTKRPKRDLFREDPRSYANRLTNTALRVLNTLISFSNSYKYVFPSHQKIADICGVHYITVGRLLRELRKDGLLTWHSTPHRSNSYVINPILKKPWMANILQFLLPALRNFVFATFSISLLGSGVKENNPDGICFHDLNLYSYIYKSYRNDSIPRNEEMRARDPSEGNDRNFAKKEGGRVTDRKESSGNLFDFTICGMKLTIAGMSELSSFNRESIEHGKKAMRTLGTWKPKDPFKYFYGVCKKWHEDFKVPLNYALVNKMRAQIEATGYEPRLEAVSFVSEARKVEKKEAEVEKITIHRSAEQVEADIRAMEENPLTAPFAGILRERCRDSLLSGETVERSSKELSLQEKMKKKLSEDMDRLRRIREEIADNEKREQGLPTKNDIAERQAKILPECGTFNQFERRGEIGGIQDSWEAVGARAPQILYEDGKSVRLPERGETG